MSEPTSTMESFGNTVSPTEGSAASTPQIASKPTSAGKKKQARWRRKKLSLKSEPLASRGVSKTRLQTPEAASNPAVQSNSDLPADSGGRDCLLKLQLKGAPKLAEDAKRVSQAASMTGNDFPPDAPDITIDQVEQWGTDVLRDPIARLAMLSVSRTDPRLALLNRWHTPEQVGDGYYFGLPPAIANAPLPHHQWCGRPYLFAGTSLMRLALIHRYNLQAEGKHADGCRGGRLCTFVPPFELSQAYLFFWDRLEKCGHFLDQVIAAAALKFNSPLASVATCSAMDAGAAADMLPWTDPVPECGSWTLVQRLVEKYGLLPADVYPGSAAFAAAPRTLDQLLATTLRQHAVRIMGAAEKEMAGAKDLALSAIFRTLAIVMGGPPPSPREAFTWCPINAAEESITICCTPRVFAQDIASQHFPDAEAGLLSRLVCIVHDPRHPEGAQLVVGQAEEEKMGARLLPDRRSLFRPHSLLNTSMDDFKMACECMLKAGYPVFIGCDAARANSHADVGLLDADAANFELAFDKTSYGDGNGNDNGDCEASTSPLHRLSKADRLRTGDSRMTHALVVTGVDVKMDVSATSPTPRMSAETGRSQDRQHVRWRQWHVQRTLRTGVGGGDSGEPVASMLMTDVWMEEYVYLAVVDPCVLPEWPISAASGNAGRLSSRAATLVRTTTGGEEERETFALSTETVVLAASDPMAASVI